MKNLNIIFIALLLFGCDKNAKKEALMMDAKMPMEMEESSVEEIYDIAPPMTRQAEAKVMREASISFEVKDLEIARADIKKLNDLYKARVMSMDQHGGNSRKVIYLTVEVRPDSLESYLEQIKNIAIYVDRQNISATDVTEEYVDIAARLKNRKVVEERYRELLSRASKVEDILKIERALQQIREEIEAAQARINYYDQRVAMSTVRIDFYQKNDLYQGEKQRSFFEKLTAGLANGWQHLLGFILIVVNLWPFLLIIVMSILFYVHRKRRRNKRPLEV